MRNWESGNLERMICLWHLRWSASNLFLLLAVEINDRPWIWSAIAVFQWLNLTPLCNQCLSLIGSILVTLAIHYGFGKPASGNDSEVSKIIMYDYLSQTFALAGGTLGRVSFIVFIVGLLVQRLSERIVLWVLAALQVIVNGMVIIIIFVQCPGHASAIWDHSGKSKCWDLRVQEYYGYFQGGKYGTSKDAFGHAFINYRTAQQPSMPPQIYTSRCFQLMSFGISIWNCV